MQGGTSAKLRRAQTTVALPRTVEPPDAKWRLGLDGDEGHMLPRPREAASAVTASLEGASDAVMQARRGPPVALP